jgi:hypothetical protein
VGTNPSNPGLLLGIGACGVVVCALIGTTGTLARPLFPHPKMHVGDDPIGLLSADLDADGHTDLVAISQADDRIVVLLGRGDGSFLRGDSYATGDGPWRGVAADFDGDGHTDLAVTGFYDGIGVFMGNGDGTFGPRSDYGDPSFSRYYVGVGDFNEDDELDLISVCAGPVRINFGNGDGTFGPDLDLEAGSTTHNVPVADFDGDGYDDFAAGGPSSDDVHVRFGHGDGMFEPGDPIPMANDPYWLTADDLNGDQVPDIAMVNDGPGGRLWVALGVGDGTFLLPRSYPIYPDPPEQRPAFIVIADIDSDGLTDLAVPNVFGVQPLASISLFFGVGGGLFTDGIAADTTQAGTAMIVVEDFDGDGIQDLASTHYYHRDVAWVFGRGDRSFITADHWLTARVSARACGLGRSRVRIGRFWLSGWVGSR